MRNILKSSHKNNSNFLAKNVILNLDASKHISDFETFIKKNQCLDVKSIEQKTIFTYKDYHATEINCRIGDIEYDKQVLQEKYRELLYAESKNYYDLRVQIEIIKDVIINEILPKKSLNKDIHYPQDFIKSTEIDIEQIQILKVMLILEEEGLIKINNFSTNFIYSKELTTFAHDDTDIVKNWVVTFNISTAKNFLSLWGITFNLTDDTIMIDWYAWKFNTIYNKLILNDLDQSKTKDWIRWLYAMYKINEANINNNLPELKINIEEDKNSFTKFYNEAKDMFWLNQTSKDITEIDPWYISKIRKFIKNNKLSIELTDKIWKEYHLKRI